MEVSCAKAKGSPHASNAILPLRGGNDSPPESDSFEVFLLGREHQSEIQLPEKEQSPSQAKQAEEATDPASPQFACITPGAAPVNVPVEERAPITSREEWSLQNTEPAHFSPLEKFSGQSPSNEEEVAPLGDGTMGAMQFSEMSAIAEETESARQFAPELPLDFAESSGSAETFQPVVPGCLNPSETHDVLVSECIPEVPAQDSYRDEFVQMVKEQTVFIHQSHRTELKIVLPSSHGGFLQLDLKQQDGGVAVAVACTDEQFAKLQEHLPELRSALKEHGIQLGDLHLENKNKDHHPRRTEDGDIQPLDSMIRPGPVRQAVEKSVMRLGIGWQQWA